MTSVAGESVFYEESRDRWVGRLELGKDGAGKRRRPKVTGPTEEVARERLRLLRQQVEQGATSQNGNLTVRTFLADWLAREVPKLTGKNGGALSPNTTESYTWAVGHLVDGLGHVRLTKLTSDHVDELLEAKAADGMARSSMTQLRSKLGRALNYARRRGLVTQNVAASDLVSIPHGPKTERRSLTPEEACRLIEAAHTPRPKQHKHGRTVEDHRTGALVTVGVSMALRPGELLGLTWPAIDWGDGVIDVLYQLVWERVNGQGPKRPRLKDAKAGSQRRLRPPGFVIDALADWRVIQQQQRQAYELDPEWGPVGIVFATRNGRPMSHANLRRDFKRTCKHAGIGYWVPYEMRHTGASLLSDSGVHDDQVAGWLGHNTTRMLNDVYRHRVRPVIDAGAAPMNQLLRGDPKDQDGSPPGSPDRS